MNKNVQSAVLLAIVCLIFGGLCLVATGGMRQFLFALFALGSMTWLLIWFPEGVVAAYLFGGRMHDARLLFEDIPMSLNQLLMLAIVYLLVVHRDRLFLSMRMWSMRGFVFFVVWMSLSLLWSMGPEYGRYKVIAYTGVVLPALACQVVLVLWRGNLRYAVVSMWGIGVALTVLGLIKLAPAIGMGSIPRLAVLGGGPNIYARMVGMGLLFSVGALAYLWRSKKADFDVPSSVRLPLLIGLGTLALVSAPAFLFAQSRGPAIALVLSLVLYILVLSKADLRLTVLVVLVIAAIFWAASFSLVVSGVGDFSRTRFDSANESNWNTYEARLDFADQTLDVVVDYPRAGVGVGGWPVALYGIDFRHYPHNFFLEVASELGVFVAGLVFVLFVTQTILAFRTCLVGVPTIDNELLLLCSVGFIYTLIAGLVTGDLVDSRAVWQFLLLMELGRRLAAFGPSFGLLPRDPSRTETG